MAKKNNNRNIRISDQMAELIDQQVGSNFTEKWENLVTRCVWELPKKEAELQRIKDAIQDKHEQYSKLIIEYSKLQNMIRQISWKAEALESILNQEKTKWDQIV